MRKTMLSYSFVLSVVLCSLPLLPLARTERLHSRHLDHLEYYDQLSYDRAEVHAHHLRLQRSSALQSMAAPAVVEFTSHGQVFTLLLQPNNAPPPRVHLVGKGGTRRVLSAEDIPNELYHGFLLNDTSSYVHGSLHDGIFDGIIHHGNETYYVEAAWKFFDPPPTSFHSIVYKVGDVRPRLPGGRGQEGGTCGGESLQDYLKEVQRWAVPLQNRVVPHRSVRSRSKRAFTSNGNSVCRLRVAVDSRFFTNVAGSSVASVNNEVTSIFNEVNQIFSNTDFNFDRQPDGIRFSLSLEIYEDPNEPSQAFANDNIQVNEFLDLWSQEDHSDVCLALLLTYRDFAGGVLGLAWVAQPPGGNLGGVCEQRARISTGERSLNSAIVTFVNFGRRQPMAVTVVTIAHELGHNFGSDHDPNTAACAPGGTDGNFIMYFSAVDGSRPNNNRFSTCSIANIRPVLESTKSSCFIAGENQCGNGLVEQDEQCDCGSDDPATCMANDMCCTTNCTLQPGKQCSPMTGDPCCTDECMFDTSSKVCQEADDCSFAVECSGLQSACPVNASSFKENRLLCNNGSNTCLSGQCSGSVCSLGGYTECLCSEMAQLCDVCCMVDDVCTSTFTADLMATLNLTGGVYRAPGRTCNNYLGYCAEAAQGAPPVCVGVNNDDFLDILRDLFTEDTLNSIILWLQTYWYIPLGIVIVVVVVIILLPLTYRKKQITKLGNTLRRRVSQRGSRRQRGRDIQEAQTGGVGRNRRRGNRRQDVSNPRRLTESEGVQRVKCFFPHADEETIRTVIRSKGNEAATVKQLLAMGYPIKKQTVDVLPIHT